MSTLINRMAPVHRGIYAPRWIMCIVCVNALPIAYPRSTFQNRRMSEITMEQGGHSRHSIPRCVSHFPRPQRRAGSFS